MLKFQDGFSASKVAFYEVERLEVVILALSAAATSCHTVQSGAAITLSTHYQDENGIVL